MFSVRSQFSLCTVAFLAACGSSGGNEGRIVVDVDASSTLPIVSAITIVTADGQFAGRLRNLEQGFVQDTDGDGYAYRAGTSATRGAVAEAGILPGTRVAPAPSNVVTFEGQYQLAIIDDISVTGTTLSGEIRREQGDLELVADFGRGTLSVDNGPFRVDGAISNGRVTGTVRYENVTGSLVGLAGADRTVGVFEGNSNTVTYAGGFVADAQE